ncbi:MAG: ferredoxin [Bacilli bacterium]|nr:ferredoxin [Bacilli bacterium]
MVKVDETKCIGCGACVSIAPENFDFNEAGLSQVIKDETNETVKEAIDACPVGAIVEVAAAANPVEEAAAPADNVIQFPKQEVEEESEKAA